MRVHRVGLCNDHRRLTPDTVIVAVMGEIAFTMAPQLTGAVESAVAVDFGGASLLRLLRTERAA